MYASIIRSCCLGIGLLVVASAQAGDVVLPRDTQVYLSTKEELIGKKGELEVGHIVRCEVWRDVLVDGHVVIAAGTPATARVDTLTYHKVAGIKGKMTLAAIDTETVQRQPVALTGGYLKEGNGRVALSASLAALVAWPLIFITGKPAELPVGTVFDTYTQHSTTLALASAATADPPVIRLGADATGGGLSAQLLYDKLQGQEKPRVFEFLIKAPPDAPVAFVIDTINGEHTDPIALTVLSSNKTNDELTVNAAASIAELVKRFRKGINTIQVAYGEGANRVGTEVVVNIQI
jgi:hypothetical protein